uniref:Putative methyltransferase n=1 Tax=Marseillevirus LCMAC102 TaxID=2506603 RepID=A0A481YTA1_9VIRU|nr:MAG: putative methyltransferase [Marseillevirus LCMAC102]
MIFGLIIILLIIIYLIVWHTHCITKIIDRCKKIDSVPVIIIFFTAFAILSFSPRHETVTVEGVRYTGKFNKSTLIRCLMLMREYEPSLTLFLKNNSLPDDVMVDVGANEGYFSVLMAPRIRKIYAVEPDPSNVELMQNNIENNEQTNIQILPIAAGSKKGKITIHSCNVNRMWSNVEDDSLWQSIKCLGVKNTIVPIQKLQNIIPEIPSIVKIDVEGHEKEVLEGMMEWIGQTRIFIVETTNMGIVNMFREKGYTAMTLPVDSVPFGDTQMPQPISDDSQSIPFSNVIFVKKQI